MQWSAADTTSRRSYSVHMLHVNVVYPTVVHPTTLMWSRWVEACVVDGRMHIVVVYLHII